jgi:hypothetical protein
MELCAAGAARRIRTVHIQPALANFDSRRRAADRGGDMPQGPLRALAVAETRPQGPTGRVGAGPVGRVSPEMRPGPFEADWVATPKRTPVTGKDAGK